MKKAVILFQNVRKDEGIGDSLRLIYSSVFFAVNKQITVILILK